MPSVTSSLLGPIILLSTLISNTLNLHSLSVTDQVSHPYKTTGKIVVLYILIYMFLEDGKTKDSVHNGNKHPQNFFHGIMIEIKQSSLS
jgi:hypothetical protein